MARVNHKRVKQLLNEKRSRITDRQRALLHEITKT